MPVSSTEECSIMCTQMSGKLHEALQYSKAVRYAFMANAYKVQLKDANVVRSVCRESSQRSRTQQLQCATVSQHSMYSYIVEPGRKRRDQHPEAVLRLGRGTPKALRVLQGRPFTVHVSLCLHVMGWNEQLRAQHRNNNDCR